MKKSVCLTLLLSLLFVTSLWAQENRIIINADQELSTISRHIYGHFTEPVVTMNMESFGVFSFLIMFPQLKTVLAKNN